MEISTWNTFTFLHHVGYNFGVKISLSCVFYFFIFAFI